VGEGGALIERKGRPEPCALGLGRAKPGGVGARSLAGEEYLRPDDSEAKKMASWVPGDKATGRPIERRFGAKRLRQPQRDSGARAI